MTAAAGSNTCDTNGSPTSCDGFFQWSDGTPLDWTPTDYAGWAPPVVRNDVGSLCGWFGGNTVHDRSCTSGSNRPLCQIDCTQT